MRILLGGVDSFSNRLDCLSCRPQSHPDCLRTHSMRGQLVWRSCIPVVYIFCRQIKLLVRVFKHSAKASRPFLLLSVQSVISQAVRTVRLTIGIIIKPEPYKR